jgi:hypothetical protein
VQQAHAQQQEQVQVQVVVIIVSDSLSVYFVQRQNVFASAGHYKQIAARVKP